MEIPVVHEIARSAKRPIVSPRSFPKPPSPAVRVSSQATTATGSLGSGGGKARGGTQPAASTKINEKLSSASISSAKTPQGSIVSSPSSSSTASTSTTKTSVKTTTTTTTTKTTTNNFLKLASTRSSGGQKPKLPAKPASLKESSAFFTSRKPAGTSTPVSWREAAATARSNCTTSTTPNTPTPDSSVFKTSAEIPDSEKRTWFSPRAVSTPVKPGSVDGKSPVQIAANRQTSVHARLPSTDSGIQADGGFDSLSRYKGKSFLSDSSGAYDSILGSDDVISYSCLSPSSSSDTLVNGDINSGQDAAGEQKQETSGCSRQRVDHGNRSDSSSSNITKNTNTDRGSKSLTTPSHTDCSVPPAAPTPIALRHHAKPQSRRPFAAPRPASSPPPAPNSAPPSSSSAARRPVRSRPQTSWRHSACLPGRECDLLGDKKDSTDFPPQSSTLPRGVSAKLFPQRTTIKTLRSTSLENFGKIIGDGLSSSKDPGGSKKGSSAINTNKTHTEHSTSSQSSSEALVLPENNTKISSSKPPAYMNVSPPPPPSNPKPHTRPTFVTSPLQPTQPVPAKRTDHAALGVSTRKNDDTSHASGAPKLHPSIKTFTSDGGVQVTFGKTPMNVPSSSSASHVQSSSNFDTTSSSKITQIFPTSTRDSRVPVNKVEDCHDNLKTNGESGDSDIGKMSIDAHQVQVLQEHQNKTDASRKAKGEGHIALTRPLRVVAPPGKLGVRTLQPATLSPKLQDLVSNLHSVPKDGITISEQRSGDLDEKRVSTDEANMPPSSQQLLHREQPQQSSSKTTPTVSPRTLVSAPSATVGSLKTSESTGKSNTLFSTESNTNTSCVIADSNAQPETKSQSKTSPVSEKSSTPTPKPTQLGLNKTSPKFGSSKSTSDSSTNAAQKNLATKRRFEIPVTHLGNEETIAQTSLNGAQSGKSNIAPSSSAHVLHRTPPDVTKTSTGRRPVSSSFLQSSSLSPSLSFTHSSTLPRNSFGKRDSRSPFRGGLGDKQKEAIYENIRCRVRDSFRFEDASSRFKHADLILKESDELINEALAMLNNSSLSNFISSSSPLSQKLIPASLSPWWKRDKSRSSSSSEDKEISKEPSTTLATKSTSVISSTSSPQSTITVERVSRKEETSNHKIANGHSPHTEKKHSDATVESKGSPVPVYNIQSENIYSNVITTTTGSNKQQEELLTPSSHGQGTAATEVTWSERKARMDSALSWLKHELACLRDMDTTLISQFKRCQDTIETLKSQRDVWEGLSEEGEECEYWDDYEINEFNKKYLDSPGGSSSSQLSPGSRNSSVYDITSVSAPRLAIPGERRGSLDEILSCCNGMTLTVEATL